MHQRVCVVGEMIELSRGTAYGLGLSQFAVTLGVVLFFPPVDVDVYVVDGQINGTTRAVALLQAELRGMRVFLAMPMLLASGLAAVFTTMTCRMHSDMGMGGQDYQSDVLEQVGMWDLCFWVYALFAHVITLMAISDPVNVFGLISCPCFMVHFLYRACCPKGPNVNLTQENLNLLGYFLGVLQMAYQLTDTRPNGATAVMIVVLLDYFLGIGHTYDRQATLDTVSNCRLFYVCTASLALTCLYALSAEFDAAATP